MTNFDEQHPDILDEIALYAGYAAEGCRDLAAKLRRFAGLIGDEGEFLRDAAQAIEDAALGDEIMPTLHRAREALNSGAPQALVRAAHYETALELRRGD